MKRRARTLIFQIGNEMFVVILGFRRVRVRRVLSLSDVDNFLLVFSNQILYFWLSTLHFLKFAWRFWSINIAWWFSLLLRIIQLYKMWENVQSFHQFNPTSQCNKRQLSQFCCQPAIRKRFVWACKSFRKRTNIWRKTSLLSLAG